MEVAEESPKPVTSKTKVREFLERNKPSFSKAAEIAKSGTVGLAFRHSTPKKTAVAAEDEGLAFRQSKRKVVESPPAPPLKKAKTDEKTHAKL